MINVNTSVSMQKRKYLCNFGAKMQSFLQKCKHFCKNANIFLKMQTFLQIRENLCQRLKICVKWLSDGFTSSLNVAKGVDSPWFTRMPITMAQN